MRPAGVEVKRLAAVRVKAADRGEVEAVFSRFGVVDADNDWTYPDAFTDGAEVVISAYQHTSWTGALPVGRGIIRTDAETAWVEASFFMDTSHGRDTFETVKQLGQLGQWSYAYGVVDSHDADVPGRGRVRFLRRLEVSEVSPVLVGVGVGVTTVDAKDNNLDPATRKELAAIAGQLDPDQDMSREFARFVASTLEAAA